MPSVTICAVDCVLPELAARALDLSRRRFPSERAILFSDENVIGNFDCIGIEKIKSISSYNNFLINKLGDFIKTDYALVVQWDGYVVNSLSWKDDFFDYDYIGAMWPQYNDAHRVGNGGFSLRSKKLFDAMIDPSFKFDEDENEDILICRTNRHFLEDRYSIKFSSEDIANQFSYEQNDPIELPFGFHGFWNMWRHESDEDLIMILSMLPDSYFKGYLMNKAVMQLFMNNRMKPFHLAFKRTIEVIDPEYLKNVLVHALNFDDGEVKKMIRAGEFKRGIDKLLSFFTP